jgi:hypothetical protein
MKPQTIEIVCANGDRYPIDGSDVIELQEYNNKTLLILNNKNYKSISRAYSDDRLPSFADRMKGWDDIWLLFFDYGRGMVHREFCEPIQSVSVDPEDQSLLVEIYH